MTPNTLKAVCAGYLGKTAADLTINSEDFFLVALNNARKQAERLHNFEYARVSGTLSIGGVSGAALSDVDFDLNSDSGRTVTVAGTLTPDATGTYTENGTFNAKPLFLKLTGTPATSFAIWYAAGFWYLTSLTNLGNTSTNDSWGAGDASGVPPDGTWSSNLSGTYAGAATITLNASSTITLKEITSISRIHSTGVYVPVPFMRTEVVVERARAIENSTGYYTGELRYPSDAAILATQGELAIHQRARRLYLYPSATANAGSSLNVQIEGYRWMPDYTTDTLATNNPDFFFEFAPDYLQWATICELNYHFEKFVPRQEGSISPPEKQRETAWRNLLLWDAYLIDPNTAE